MSERTLDSINLVQRQVGEVKKITKAIVEDLKKPLTEEAPAFDVLAFLFDSQPFLTVEVLGEDLKPIYINRAMHDLVRKFGGSLSFDEPCYKSFWNKETVCYGCCVEEVLKTGEMQKIEFYSNEIQSQYELMFVPLRDNGTKAVLVMGHKSEVGGNHACRRPDTS